MKKKSELEFDNFEKEYSKIDPYSNIKFKITDIEEKSDFLKNKRKSPAKPIISHKLSKNSNGQLEYNISKSNDDDDAISLTEKRIPREFFMTDAVILARELLGKIIVRKINDSYIRCIIVETEAYMGPHDKGAHSFNNRKTERTKHFWAKGGSLYIYSIHQSLCLNIVANDDQKPEAVLIRAMEPLVGFELIKKLRKDKSTAIVYSKKTLINLTNGPGKVGAALNIDKSKNGLDCCESDEFHIIDNKDYKFEIERSTRININYAEEYRFKPWRFYIKDNPYVSKVKIEHKYKDE